MRKELVNPMEFEKFPTLGYLRLPQVLRLIPVCKATWWNGCKTGQYPKPYKPAPRITAWKVKDILKCIVNFPPANPQE